MNALLLETEAQPTDRKWHELEHWKQNMKNTEYLNVPRGIPSRTAAEAAAFLANKLRKKFSVVAGGFEIIFVAKPGMTAEDILREYEWFCLHYEHLSLDPRLIN